MKPQHSGQPKHPLSFGEKILIKIQEFHKWLRDQYLSPTTKVNKERCERWAARQRKNDPNHDINSKGLTGHICSKYLAQEEETEQSKAAVAATDGGATGIPVTPDPAGAALLEKRKKPISSIFNSWKTGWKRLRFTNPKKDRERKEKKKQKQQKNHMDKHKHKNAARVLPESAPLLTHNLALPAHNTIINARSIGGSAMNSSEHVPIVLYLIGGLLFIFASGAILNWCFGRKNSLDPVEADRRRLLDPENAWLDYEEVQEEEWNVERVPEGLGSLTN